jgi:molybdopterin-guanine dinucleotide biosynthesis protein A
VTSPDNKKILNDLSCVILVGGESRRIGTDKARVELKGKKLFSHVFEKLAPLFNDIMIGAHDQEYPIDALGDIKGARFITDQGFASDERGPALGLCSALDAALNPWVFTVACDHPLIVPALIEYMATLKDNFDCVVPITGGKLQPLFALYNKNCLAPLGERIKNAETKKGRSLYGFLKETKGLRVKYITEDEAKNIDPDLTSFIDIDTQEELLKIEKTYDRKTNK